MDYFNEMTLRFKAIKENESFVRLSVASFCATVNPTVEELGDVKTALSEAVTNSIVHAYPNGRVGDVVVNVKLNKEEIYITVSDFGVGIDDIDKARQPFFTSKPNSERSGMGFTVMEGFMDSVVVLSQANKGVVLTMTKKLGELELAIGG